MSTSTDTVTDQTTQVYRVYIKATPQKIWDAITEPEWNARYGYGAPGVFDLRPGGAYTSTASDEMRKYAAEHGLPMQDVIVDGEVLEVDPPRKLVQTWRLLMDESTAKEPFTKLTYEISELPAQPGVCRLTVTHDVAGAPATGAMTGGALEESGAGGGWAWVLSDLKTLVETGSAFSS
ncbi:SRPBCC domain-containing protein [Micromonospora sp. NPDC004704]